MNNILYQEIYNSANPIEDFRFKMVTRAKEVGIKPTAKEFETSPTTVRKWLRRYEQNHSKKALADRSRAPKHSPNSIPIDDKKRIIRKAQKLIRDKKRLKAAYIKRDLNLSYSLHTIIKILKKEGLYKKKLRSKAERKKDMRSVKAKMRAFELIQVDIKYLDDIPEFYETYRKYSIPKYQITGRDVKTGTLYLSLATEKSGTNTLLFLDYLYKHLKRHGIDTKRTIIQTDNGSEFVKKWNSRKETAFTKYANKFFRLHRTIPVGAKTYQSDVETSHRWIEDEFYAYAYFKNEASVYSKLKSYVYRYNTERENNYKGANPYEILKSELPNVKKGICKLKPVIIDKFIDNIEKINIMIK